MKIKVRKLVEMKPSLQKLITQDIPVKTAFKVGKTIKVLEKEYEVYEESKRKLFKKYGEENIDGNLKIKEENIKVFNEDLEELMNIEVDIELQKIKIGELGEDTKLAGIDMFNLDILLEE